MSEHKSAPQISKLSRFSLFVLVSFLVLLILSSSLLIKVVRAANAVPAPGRIPCDPKLPEDSSDPEYASDRPYQASPCSTGDGGAIAAWCGNNVVVILGTSSTPYCDRENGQKDICPCNGGPNCDHTGSNMQKIDIDLTNVELPILGNTNDTKNSQTGDTIDDGTKVSNYVAWYLGGIDSRAEYPASATTSAGLSRTVDFSGPLRRLLPSVIQEATRSASVANANAQATEYDDETGQDVTGSKNHNQIVVCAKSNAPLGIGNWVVLGTYTPVDCYDGGGKPANDKVFRLVSAGGVLGTAIGKQEGWDGDLSLWNTLFNDIVGALTKLFPSVPADIINKSVADHWNSRLPPLPWSDKDGKPFANDALYQKAYNEWRGKTCILIPGVNLVICIENIFVPNVYADLFQYIPLANTVDKKGAHAIEDTHLDAPKATIVCGSQGCYDIIHSPQLYLAHSLENYQLSTLLKNTYLPGSYSASAASQITAGIAALPPDVEVNGPATCRIIPSRSNPGDDATFDEPKSHIEVDVSYIATDIHCTPNPAEKVCDDNDDCSSYHYEAHCSSEVYATVATVSKTPFADKIWNNTVASSDSIFRRIYPKSGVGAPINCIADIPAQSKATYTVDPNSSKEVQLWKIIEPDKSVVTGEGGAKGSDTIDAQLYYPHYGGVLDYFLNGIQQALRPKGFGPGQPQNGQYCTNIKCGELPELPSASGSCKLGGTSSSVGTIPQSLKDIISAAANTYKVPPNLILGIMFGEGLFEPGRFNWSDENVKNWATCMPIPGCNTSGDDNFMGFNGNDFSNITPHILPDLQKLDPTRKTLSQCNLLDAIYAEAWNLHDSADGGGGLPATCYGIGLSAPAPSSCDWTNEQYESAIKVSESGYTSDCFTRPGSCATGASAATCVGGDICEKLGGTNNTSHNACVWDVAHGQ